MRNVRRFRLRAHGLKVDSYEWLGGSNVCDKCESAEVQDEAVLLSLSPPLPLFFRFTAYSFHLRVLECTSSVVAGKIYACRSAACMKERATH
eukprot:498431-Pelagomonas_calceolata.AAC.1